MSIIKNNLKKIARETRLKMVNISSVVNAPIHWGGSLSCIEILVVLFKEILKSKKYRDKFLLSKGHASIALYAVLNSLKLLDDEMLYTYQQDGSMLSEIVEKNQKLGFETSGGSLGINLSYAVGLSLKSKLEKLKFKTFILSGDGELDEGSIWEAVMLASQLKLNNLTLIVDCNRIQSDGYTKNIISWSNILKRFEAFGWTVCKVNGHSPMDLLAAFHKKTSKPKVIIAKTIKGKGISFMENDPLWHDKKISKDEIEKALKELEFC